MDEAWRTEIMFVSRERVKKACEAINGRHESFFQARVSNVIFLKKENRFALVIKLKGSYPYKEDEWAREFDMDYCQTCRGSGCVKGFDDYPAPCTNASCIHRRIP